ncbi:hypothetical protein DNTS_003283 [Danionella cerebrum]|uniref:Uncharacterized protein n=1 Tax=Danionella cerebrum TaxID=2873325 RepID=A0A553MVJ1_9TELE|nr:hypothetical protein DNTS_003283 [Danionella translucida]
MKNNNDVCARKIQTYWRSFRDRRLFTFLKNTVIAAEQAPAPAILRQLSPKEAELLKDPTPHYRLRFRFAGSQFPPSLVFKIFQNGGGQQALSRQEVSPSSIQFCRHPDELPARLGGRENGWRFLSLKVFSRDFGSHEAMKPGTKSFTAALERFHRQQPFPFTCQQIPHRGSRSSRSSKRDRSSVARKRCLYSLEHKRVSDEQADTINNRGKMKQAEKCNIRIVLPSVTIDNEDEDSPRSEWEEEAETLYSWSKELYLDSL